MDQAIRGLIPIDDLSIVENSQDEDYPEFMCNFNDPALNQFCSSMLGERTNNPDDYVLRFYEGSVQPFLKSHMAMPVLSVDMYLVFLEVINGISWYRVEPQFHKCNTRGDPQIMEDDGCDPSLSYAIESFAEMVLRKTPISTHQDITERVQWLKNIPQFWNKYCLVCNDQPTLRVRAMSVRYKHGLKLKRRS